MQGSTWQYLLMTATCLRSSSVLMSRYLRIILKVEYVKNDKIVIEIWNLMFYRFPAAAVWRSRVKATWWLLQRTIIMFWSSTLSTSPDRPSWQQQDEWSRDRTLVRGHFCDLSILPIEHAMVMQVSIFSFPRFNIKNIQSFCCFADACAKENC